MWAVVGLGNPGRSYSETRHNVGFIFIKRVAKGWKVRLRRRIFSSKAVQVERKGDKVLLSLPQTYMNRSGLAVKQIMEGRGIHPENLIVVFDDLDIPVGDLRIRKEGSAGTHKGMCSIIEELGTHKFPRIRIGIGSSALVDDATEFVLSSFEKAEKLLLEESLRKAQEALEMMLDGEIERAMSIYNQRKKPLED
ncbi:MAG: aminoacyl-tRNA hydrolase [Candidatus Aminicenantes bacterium]|nr:MAG: aminoacyl-tRNA hydrolase [Candidatus Aminicenantes bacterium]